LEHVFEGGLPAGGRDGIREASDGKSGKREAQHRPQDFYGPVFEAALIELRRKDIYASPEPVVAFQNCQNTLGSLFRYETALMNALNRTLQQLLFLQTRRAEETDVRSSSNEPNTAAQ
jgi:hypothetical protein